MSEIGNSTHVCYSCQQRKKRCDKALPTCGFCRSHNLRCRYDLSAPKNNGQRKYNPGRNFVLLPDKHKHALTEPIIGRCSIHLGPCTGFLSEHDISCHDKLSDSESISVQVHALIHSLQLSPEDIGDHYFRTFHKLLPIISPALFSESLADHWSDQLDLPPNFSVLLLSMCLVATVSSCEHISQPSYPTRNGIYQTTKVLLMKIETLMAPSMQLLQATLLVSLCEYAAARPETAYISLGTCVAIARILGIGQSSGAPNNVPSCSSLAEIERVNIAWGMALVER